MSYRKEKIHSLTGINLNIVSESELKKLCNNFLKNGLDLGISSAASCLEKSLSVSSCSLAANIP